MEQGFRQLLSWLVRVISRHRATLGLLSFSLALILFALGANSELFRFPFNASVWGTASDYIMILVTATTAIYIYRTLKSQQETQKILSRQINLEEAKFRLQIVPKFEADLRKEEDPKTYIVSPSITLNLQDHGAQYLRVFLREESKYYVSESPPYERGMNKGYTYVIKIKLTEAHEPGYTLDTSSDNFEILYLEYQDVAGNRYIQRVVMLLREIRPITHADEPQYQFSSKNII